MGGIIFTIVIVISVIIVLNLKLSDYRSESQTYHDRAEKLETEKSDITKKYREQVAELESKYNYLCSKYAKLEKDADNFMTDYNRLKTAEGGLMDLKKRIAESRDILSALDSEILIKTYNFSDYDGITSEECKNKLSLLKTKEKDIIKSGEAVILSSVPEKGDKKLYTNNTKQILRCFNTECDNILMTVTFKNIDSLRSKMQKSFETLNSIYEIDRVQLNRTLLAIKLEELNLVYTAEVKKESEREEQRAIKAQMLEEEKVRREIEKEKQKIEKEEHQFKNEISKLMKYMQKATEIEKQLYIDKINELEQKLKLLEKDRENVLEREQNTRAGYVYVISNIGSFGENVYKIGMTRRLEPMDRVKELGDASVPFEFDVHAMIFSEDAPKLENILHETFRKYQVNKVNNRKEFFKVPLEDIESVVKQNHNATVTFTMIAKAEQYIEILRLAESAV